jgi:hypothetical protein
METASARAGGRGGAKAGVEVGGETSPLHAERRRAARSDAPGTSFAGELERAHRRVVFPPGARVLFVTAAARADRLRKRLGPSSRVLLAAKIYGKPYLVIASH